MKAVDADAPAYKSRQLLHAMGNNYGKLADNPGEVYISFRSGIVSGIPPGDAHVGFEVGDGPLHDGSYLVEGIQFIGIPLDAREHAEVHVFVSIGGTSFFGSAAGSRTVIYPFAVYHVDFRVDPFVAVRTFSWQCPAYFMTRLQSLGQVG